jgi:di/tricarboxylate transporter
MDFATLQLIAVFATVVGVVLAFFREWAEPDLVALAALGCLLLSGALSVEEALDVFRNPAPITIACMFVLSAGLERSGCIDVMARVFQKLAGQSELRVMVVLMVLAAALSAFVNNTPVVVVFLPIVLSLAKTTGLKASRLLIPLSFASILGGTCTLTGTSTNLIIDGVVRQYGEPAFSMFELSRIGLIYAVVGITYILLIGRRLLPLRDTLDQEIEPAATRDFLTQFMVEPDSPLVGKTLTDTLIADIPDLRVLEVRRRGVPLAVALSRLEIQADDRILLKVHGPGFQELRDTEGIAFDAEKRFHLRELEQRQLKLMEGIVGPQSTLAGQTLKNLRFRQRFGVQILAVHRQGQDLRADFGDVRLHFGDVLLIQGSVDAINRVQREVDFVKISEPREKLPGRGKALMGAGITFAFVLGAALQIMPIVGLALLAAIAMLVSGTLKPHEAYRSVGWNILFLIFGMLALGRALETTGGAQLVVGGIMHVFGNCSPTIILAVIYLLSSTLTELISNNAVAALLCPIVLGIAEALGVDARPFIVAMMLGCSASFATPIGYQTNTYIYGAGGYRFSDFARVGLPLNLLLWLMATFLIPFFWPFSSSN